MSNKPKWSVELHGECPFPDRYDVIEVAADLPPSGPNGGGLNPAADQTITGAWEFADLSLRSPDDTAHPLTVENDGSIVSAHGPTADANIVWGIDGDGNGAPIAADAGAYELVGRVIHDRITINVGDDEATIQAAFDTLLTQTFGDSHRGYTATVTGDWSAFTVESNLRAIIRTMDVASNTMTLGGEAVDWPFATIATEGHGIYVDMPGLYGDLLGRATTEAAWSGPAFMDPTSEHYADAGWVKWDWLHGSERGVTDTLGGTIDRMDVQRHVLETGTYRRGQVSTQAYSDANSGPSVAAYLTAQIDKDGTERDIHLRFVQSDLTGALALTVTDAAVQGLLRANPGQTDSVLVIQDEDGATAFEVAPDGAPILRSPDGTAYRLIVANDGTLSTVAV